MLSRLHHGPPSLAGLLRRPTAVHVRRKTTETKASAMLNATTDLAKKLADTGIWKGTGGRKKAGSLQAVEPNRVNIVSKKLCDDIVKYLGPSLERHRGCDLIDLNPGAGLWSRGLHEFLEPRSHIMMDLDAELYRPYLSDLLDKQNVHLIPKSGVIWKDLFEMIHTNLSHQRELTKGEPRTRNDTLLVTANLSMFPKKAFLGFESVSTMVIYQFLSSIKSSSLFQKYGLVRMLIWVNDEDKRRLVPRSINRRKRGAFEAELACDWIHEVAGHELEVEGRYTLRDDWINLESGYNTLGRMKKSGLVMPRGRGTKLYKECKKSSKRIGQKLAGVRAPAVARPFKQELEELEQEFEQEDSMEASKRLRVLRSREKVEAKDALGYLKLLQEYEAISHTMDPSSEEFAIANAAWNDKIDNFNKNHRMEFNVMKDGYHIFRQDPPALLWDRREYEPLTAAPDEFFPNAPSTLLDIQPKAMHPLLREFGPKSNRAGDMSEVMLRFWWSQSLAPVQKAMTGLWPGFGDLITECPSLMDVTKGGSPMTGHGLLTVRCTNEVQWTELMEAWMRWPFKPTYSQMLGRLVEDNDADDEDESKSGATGGSF